MGKKFDAKDMVLNIISEIENNKVWLSEIDGAIGDGDHGINMAKGFGIIKEKIDTVDNDLPSLLKLAGMTLLTNIGGAMGPIYGTFFLRMGKVIEGKDELEKEDILGMLTNALDGVRKRGGARVGDKTLVDTLEPAMRGYKKAIDKGKEIDDAIDRMIECAKSGRDSTKNLIAKKGRSSRLLERSKGTIDAGAESCYIILKAFGEYVKRS